MRPLELSLRNFRSFFGDGHTFDFRDRHLVGIVGPIGAGKSSILDAIAFALYGRTPRINRSTKSLIHQRADHAAVRFRFEVDGQIWEAVRQLRAKGQSQHALYLLEEDVENTDKVAEKIVLEGEVNERIEALLGFDYDAFGRSVLLAQGQFAEFLNSRPAERDKVLKGVFGHERIDAMRELAKVKVKDTDHEIEKLGIRLEQAEAAIGRMAGRREQRVDLAARLDALEGVQPEFDTLSVALGESASRVEGNQTRIGELARLAEKLPDATRSEEAIGVAERARSRRNELAAELKIAHDSATKAEAALKSDEFSERSSRLKKASELVVRLDTQRDTEATSRTVVADVSTRVAAALEARVTADRTVETATVDLSSAIELAADASKGLVVAEQALLAARHADMASSLRNELEAGHDCPVCAQPVHDVPAVVGASGTVEAEAAVESARVGRDRSESGLRATTAAVEAAKAAADAAETRVVESEKELGAVEATAADTAAVVTATETEIGSLLGEGDPAVQLEAERLAIDQLGADVEGARKAVEDIRRSLDEAIATEQEADRVLGDLRIQLVAMATQLDAETQLPEDDPSALRSALESLRNGWKAATAELSESIDADKAAQLVANGRLAELREVHDVIGSLTDVLATARAALSVADDEISKDEALVDAAKDLLAERERLDGVAGAYRRLSTDLTDARFIRFLLDEERGLLGELGSEHFQRLSSGRYRFSDDGTFQVVDLTAADSIRKADSLSGGETFLASLGLALGLSEMVGRTGSRLDAFFLDEGFGSLDTEHLDLAMEGIEALVTDHAHRLVVVVSHVPELRHRIEDLIVLDKDPITGDSIVMSGATA